jgi:hypothetical protein
MNDNTAWILLWMLIVAGFGFLLGWDLGDETRRRDAQRRKSTLFTISSGRPRRPSRNVSSRKSAAFSTTPTA